MSKESILAKLRKEAKRKGYSISKGYKKNRLIDTFILDENGQKIEGYTVQDNTGTYYGGLESTEIYTMSFEELQAFLM